MLRCAALRCAALCCAVRCAVLCCAASCCIVVISAQSLCLGPIGVIDFFTVPDRICLNAFCCVSLDNCCLASRKLCWCERHAPHCDKVQLFILHVSYGAWTLLLVLEHCIRMKIVFDATRLTVAFSSCCNSKHCASSQ